MLVDMIDELNVMQNFIDEETLIICGKRNDNRNQLNIYSISDLKII